MTNESINENVLNIVKELIGQKAEAHIRPESITDLDFYLAIKSALNELYKSKKISVQKGLNHKVIQLLHI